MERLARFWRRLCTAFLDMMDADVYDTLQGRRRQADEDDEDHDETPRPPHP